MKHLLDTVNDFEWREMGIRQIALWGRDQNTGAEKTRIFRALPDSPCGGEIKTASQKREFLEHSLEFDF